MKKLYVLVFLIMFMGKMFSSSTNQESFQVPQTPAELKRFAAEIGLTESDLKPSFFKDFRRTGDERFILNLQKQLIKKITKSTDANDISKLLETLSLSNKRLPVGIRKTTEDLQADLSAVLTKEMTKSKGKIDMNIQRQINGFSLNPKSQFFTVTAQTLPTVDPRIEQSQQNILQAAQQKVPTKDNSFDSKALKKQESSPIGPIEKAKQISRMTGSTITVYIEPKTEQGRIIQSKTSTQLARPASFKAPSPPQNKQAQANFPKAPTIRSGSLTKR